MADINPQYPLYIPTKGRYKIRLTSDYLSYMKVPHTLIVEQQEYDNYSSVTYKNKYVTLLVLDKKYQDEYETLDDLGDTKSKGPGAARNFAWQHSIDNGYDYHWVMDDNISEFYRANNNRQIRVSTGAIFRAMEDFMTRYENCYMGGPNYFMFQPRKMKKPPFMCNTRIYSCNFIKNDIPYRWRGRYNEDTILSLDILKDGFCTIQFNAFLQNKVRTSTLRGGNSGEFYDKEGTLPKSQMLADVYPQYAKVKWRFSRIHHYVDYTPFKKNKLIKKSCINFAELKKVNNYGMKIKKVK
jgi:hypothetical protein